MHEPQNIKSIIGRITDFLVSKDNEIKSPLMFYGEMSPLEQEPLVSLINQFYIIQEENLDIEICLIAKETINENIKDGLIRYTKKMLGNINVTIRIIRDNNYINNNKIDINKIDKNDHYNINSNKNRYIYSKARIR